MVSLACIVAGLSLSLLAAFARWSQPSASEGEHAIRVGIPSAIFFVWLWLLYGYYWRQSCAAWEGFRQCAAATNFIRLVGVLHLRFAVFPAVASYPPGQLPFECAFTCNMLLMLVPAALTPPNRMRLALASGLQTVRLSQLQPGLRALAQSRLRDAASASEVRSSHADSDGLLLPRPDAGGPSDIDSGSLHAQMLELFWSHTVPIRQHPGPLFMLRWAERQARAWRIANYDETRAEVNHELHRGRPRSCAASSESSM